MKDNEERQGGKGKAGQGKAVHFSSPLVRDKEGKEKALNETQVSSPKFQDHPEV